MAMNVLEKLYEARARRFRATPGSREWWRAIRDMRAAKQQFREAVAAVGKAIRSFGRALANSVRKMGEVLSELGRNMGSES
jgi:hypothetical protein